MFKETSAFLQNQTQKAQHRVEANPFADIYEMDKTSTMVLSEREPGEDDLDREISEQLPEEDMKIKNLQRGRESLSSTFDVQTGIHGITPTKRWYEDDTRLTEAEKTLCVKKLVEAYDSPGSMWLRKFIGEENTHQLLSRVIENAIRD